MSFAQTRPHRRFSMVLLLLNRTHFEMMVDWSQMQDVQKVIFVPLIADLSGFRQKLVGRQKIPVQISWQID